VFAEGQAAIAAQQIAAVVRGQGDASTYDGTGVCYLEFGNDEVAKVQVTFVSGQPPRGYLEGPSTLIAQDKVEFGASRIRRWFDHEWATD
jgi:sulfide:quinone oxidoreductase